LEDAADLLGRLGQDGLRIGDDEGADGGSDDDQELERLEQHGHIAMRHIATQDGADHHDEADDEKHNGGRPYSAEFVPLHGVRIYRGHLRGLRLILRLAGWLSPAWGDW